MKLSPAAEDLLLRSVAWMDRYWDESFPQEGFGLLWAMGEVCDTTGSTHEPYHLVRESAWYALGLLLRDGASDAGRAARALAAVLAYQFDEPGRVYHGTFRRAPEEPHPLEYAPDGDPQEWKHYDPNWREFIVTTFSVILDEFAPRLPRSLVDAMNSAIRVAVAGALSRGLTAHYTNIALMHAQMLTWAGHRFDEPEWTQAGEAMGRETHRLFKRHDAFGEYNSPTYYGVNIYALGLWQAYCPSAELGRLAAEIEALLWRDIARFYHAGLRNVAGAYDRSYGMDMNGYAALLGLWVWLVTGRESAPFPDVTRSFAHAADFCFGPLVAILGPRVPPDVVPHLTAFQGERLVERVIPDSPNEGLRGRRREVTAWLGERAMVGAQRTSLSDIGQGQFHPATIHWQLPDDADCADTQRVGWVRLKTDRPVSDQRVDAVAAPHRLEVIGLGPLAFQIHAPGLDPRQVTGELWQAPGLNVTAQANCPAVVEASDESLAAGEVTVRYAGEDGRQTQVILELSL